MEEIKRMIEEAKHPHFNDAGHPHEGTYMFSEELFSLLEMIYREGFREGVVAEAMARAGDIEPGMGEAIESAWQQLRKAIDKREGDL